MKTPLLFIPAILCALASPSHGVNVLFLGGQAGPTQGADPAVMTFLEERYGAENVTYQQTDVTNTGDELGFDLLVLSSTPGSGTMRGKFQNSTTPILNWEEALTRNAAGEFAVTDGRTKDTAADHTIVIRENHPITAGFTVGQEVMITGPSSEVWWSTDLQAPGALSMANEKEDETRLFITIVEEGDELLTATPAPARRVMFGMTDATFDMFTDDGKTLFGQALDWAAGVSGGLQQFQFTDIVHDRDSDSVDITWTSRVGRFYTLFISPDLNTFLEIEDSLVGEKGTTTYTDGSPASVLGRRFYRISENP